MTTLNIGGYRLSFLLDANFKLDGGAMFGIVPKPLWSQSISSDDKNRIPLASRSMLIEGEEHKILVDTGIGSKWSEKEEKIFDIDPPGGEIVQKLQNRGISRNEVTHVIFTHLHFDHAGATTYYNEQDQLELTFPEATYFVQKEQLDWARNPTEKDAGSFREVDFRPLLESNCLELVEGDTEVLPGIYSNKVDGHTSGLQMIEIEGNDQRLVFATDLIPTHHHLQLPYIMGYDLWPLQTLEHKKELLARACKDQLIIAFQHDRDVRVATVQKQEENFKIADQIL